MNYYYYYKYFFIAAVSFFFSPHPRGAENDRKLPQRIPTPALVRSCKKEPILLFALYSCVRERSADDDVCLTRQKFDKEPHYALLKELFIQVRLHFLCFNAAHIAWYWTRFLFLVGRLSQRRSTIPGASRLWITSSPSPSPTTEYGSEIIRWTTRRCICLNDETLRWSAARLFSFVCVLCVKGFSSCLRFMSFCSDHIAPRQTLQRGFRFCPVIVAALHRWRFTEI